MKDARNAGLLSRSLLTAALLLAGPVTTLAQHGFPSENKLVHDEAQVLQPEIVVGLERELEHYADSTGIELAVVTVRSLRGQDVALVGDSIKNAWGVGSKKTQRGILYLIAPNERRQTIRTGRGLEADLPDALCFRILRQTQPRMSENMEGAIVNRVVAIQTYLAEAARREVARLAPADSLGQAASDSTVTDETTAPLNREQVVLVDNGAPMWVFLLVIAGLLMLMMIILGQIKTVDERPSPVARPEPPRPNPFPKQKRRSSGGSGDGLLAAALLLSEEDEKKKKKKDSSSSSSWGGFGSSTDDSGGFNFGGDTDTGGGGASDSW